MIDAIASSALLRPIVLFGLFLLVVVAVNMLARQLASRAAVRGRLQEPVIGESLVSLADGMTLRQHEQNRSWSRMTKAIEKAGIRLTDESNSAQRKKLALAGFTAASAPAIFTLVRLVLLFALPVLFLLLVLTRTNPPSFLTLYLLSMLLAAVGMYLPILWLNLRAGGRRREIINGFPDCLDLMLVCVEAGLSMEAAFDRVGREVVRSHPRLAELLSAATLELRAGASRELALRNFADRAQAEEIKAFTTLLIQSEKLGTSIGTTLRVYSREMRQKRRLTAEEKAYRLPVLLSIPLVTCMLPTMIGVLMLPASIRVVRVLIPILTKGAN